MSNDHVIHTYFRHANHFLKEFPTTTSPCLDLLGNCKIFLAVTFDFVRNTVCEQFLIYPQQLARKNGVILNDHKPGKNVKDIQCATLKGNVGLCTNEYLVRVLTFLKIPMKHDLSWIRCTQ